MTSEKMLQHLQRLHEGNKGKKRTPEQRARISEGSKGKIIPQSVRAKISATLSRKPGHKHTPESRAKISASRKISPAAQAQLQQLHALRREKRWSTSNGKPRSEETKRKISESNKKRYSDPEFRRRLSDNAKIRCADTEYREGLSIRGKKYIENHPEERTRLSMNAKIQMADPSTRENLSKRHRGDKNHNWKNGASFYPYCPKFNKSLKERVRKFFGNACILCGLPSEDNWGAALSVHHVFTEKMTCCESKIEEMEAIRKRLPPEIISPGAPEFTELEIAYIRMLVPLCKKCHGKMIREELGEIPFHETKYRKFFAELIMKHFGGKCF